MKISANYKKISTFLLAGFLLAIVCFLNQANALIVSSIERIHRVEIDAGANGYSATPKVSSDGRYVGFISQASNIVPDDTNDTNSDVFLYDTQTEDVSLVSVDSNGDVGEGNVLAFDMSSDGRYFVFSAGSANFVPADTNGAVDVFLHDTQTGDTTRVSIDSSGVEGDSDSNSPSISSDGRYITFHSDATNLVAGDTNLVSDIFLHDTQTGATTRVSVDSLGVEGDQYSGNPVISADGDFIIFNSLSTNLVTGDTNGTQDVFLHDTQTGDTTRVSVDSLGVEGDLESAGATISGDGRYVAFHSESTNLVAGDTNGFFDIFLHDTQTGDTTRVSVDSLGTESDAGSYSPFISGDGRYVSFHSFATNLIPAGNTIGDEEVYLHDTQTGDTTRVSVDSFGNEGNGQAISGGISEDGRYVVFYSVATNLIADDINGNYDVFLHDTQTGDTVLISKSYSPSVSYIEPNFGIQGGRADMSSDGRYMVFASGSTNLVTNDTNSAYDVFVYDRQTETIERVSVDNSGNEGDDDSSIATISADGRYVAFFSFATNLVPGDTNGVMDVFVYDRQTDIIERVNVDSLGNETTNTNSAYFYGIEATPPGISSDGRYIAFSSDAANLVPGDTNGGTDVFVRDRQTNTTERISVDNSGNEGDGGSLVPSISADGRYVAFHSGDQNLIPGPVISDQFDVYVYDRHTDTIERITTPGSVLAPNDFPERISISADGRYIGFSGGSAPPWPLLIYDQQTDTTERADVDSSGNPFFNASHLSMSLDGRYVVFDSNDESLIPEDTNGRSDVFVHDRQTNATKLVSKNSLGNLGNGGSLFSSISGDGQYVTFTSDSDNLTSGDTLGFQDIFYVQLKTASLSYSGSFTELSSNNGSVTGSRVVTITNDTFTNAGGTLTLNTDYTLTNAPAGLTPVMTVSGDGTTATLTFTGNASAHANSNDVSTLTITFLDSAFTLEQNAVSVTNYTDALGVINFQDSGSSGGGGSGPSPVLGCTDSDADNYNPAANQDNDSCLYVPGAITGCTDVSAGNYNAVATVDNGSCLYGIFGCTDVLAVNFNPLAQYSNNSCQYGPPIDPPDDDPDTIDGCMDPGALNYDPDATVNSVPCDYLVPVIDGCTDISAENYNEDATNDDGSCAYKNPPGGGGDGLLGVISSVVDAITGFVKENPEIPMTVSILGLLIPLISNLLSPGNLARLISIPIRIWNIIPTLLGFKRRKRPWGTVYDSITKQPLDPVYVMLKTFSGKEIATSITDLDGRYGFQVDPGQYSLFANKTNYIFPSVKLAGKTEDELYDNLYFGGGIDIAKEDEIINKNIPMDAVNFNWNEFEKAKNKKLMKFYSKTELFLARISKVLFIAGFISSIILTLVEPKTFNIIILSLYILILILALFGVKPRAFGFVNEKATGYPLSFGIISVFSSKLGKEVAHSVIGKTGKYYLLVPKGNYFVKLRKKTGEETYEDIYQSEPFNANKGYINKIIKV